MAKHNEKKVFNWVPTSDVVLKVEENNRDPKRDYDNIAGLMNDIRDNGQKQAVILRKLPDGLHPLQGFRRTYSIIELFKLFPNGFETTDENGKVVINKFDRILAEVIECNDDEAFVIMSDHGNVEPLSQVGLHITLMRAFDHKKTEKWIVNNLRGVLDQRHVIPAAKLKEMRDKVEGKLIEFPVGHSRHAVERQKAEEDVYFNYRRGLIQQVHRVYDSPNVVQEAYLNKTRGEQSWPSDAEVKDGLSIYEAERTAEPLKINKASPGPKFMDWWNKLTTSKEAAIEAGETPRPNSQMNRKDVEEMIKGTSSVLLKFVMQVVLRNYNQEIMAPVDALQVKIESQLPAELKAELDRLVASVSTPPTAAK